MPTTQATALSETTLDDLTPSGERIPQLNRCDSHSGFHHIAPSIADSYIPEIHFARTQRLTKVGPEADPPLRPTLRQFVSAISSHKITRRTFYFMILFGFTTIFYNSMNLIPAFRGTKFASEELIIQRINGFIQECLSRNSQKLPLGPDCTKYLTTTPKAPVDIEEWLINPPSDNLTEIPLPLRPPQLVPRQAGSQDGEVNNLPPEINDIYLTNFQIVLVMSVSILAILLYAKQRRKFFTLYDRYMSRRLRPLEFCFGRTTVRFLAWSYTIWILYSFVQLGGSIYWVFFMRARWSAAADFLATCEAYRKSNLPLGDDCVKYLEKELKPQPSVTVRDIATFVLWFFGAVVMGVSLYSGWRDRHFRQSDTRIEEGYGSSRIQGESSTSGLEMVGERLSQMPDMIEQEETSLTRNERVKGK